MNGITPVHACVISGNHEVLEFLINYGADIKLKSNRDMTALEVWVNT